MCGVTCSISASLFVRLLYDPAHKLEHKLKGFVCPGQHGGTEVSTIAACMQSAFFPETCLFALTGDCKLNVSVNDCLSLWVKISISILFYVASVSPVFALQIGGSN